MIDKSNNIYQEDLHTILECIEVDKLAQKRFLITGATGLIGTCLVDALMLANQQEEADITLYCVGRDKGKASERLGEYFGDSHFHFLEQDVRIPFPASLQVDYIIPLASNTHPLAYSQHPVETIEINVKGAENALQKALECDAEVLYPSSVEIYGNARGEDLFTEDYTGQLNLSTARSCYTESKRVSEAMCQSYVAEHGAKVKIVRLSRIFGPTMLLSDTKASSQFILKALHGEDIVLKSKGEQYFSYTYAADAVSAMLFVLLHGDNGQAYNVSSETCNIHLKDFAALCATEAGKEVVFDLPTASERKGYSVASQAILDSSRLKGLGWKPHFDANTSIRRTIAILKNSL